MYVGLKQPRGDGERCVTPARAAAKETKRLRMIRKPAFGKHDLSIFFDDQDQRSTPSVIDRKGKYTQKRASVLGTMKQLWENTYQMHSQSIMKILYTQKPTFLNSNSIWKVSPISAVRAKYI